MGRPTIVLSGGVAELAVNGAHGYQLRAALDSIPVVFTISDYMGETYTLPSGRRTV
jgi:hypothetical protein